MAGEGANAQGVALKGIFRRAWYAIDFHGYQDSIYLDEPIGLTLLRRIASTLLSFTHLSET